MKKHPTYVIAIKAKSFFINYNERPTRAEQRKAIGKKIYDGVFLVSALTENGAVLTKKHYTYTTYLFNLEWAITGYTPYGAPTEMPGFMRFCTDSTIRFESIEAAQKALDSLPKGNYFIKKLNKK